LSVVTDAAGFAQFYLTSSVPTAGIVTVSVDGVAVSSRPTVEFTAVGSSPYNDRLIKLPDDGNAETQFDTTVYYVGKDGKRHAFPNAKIYFTWYQDFSTVQVVSATEMAAIPLGANVTFKPGVLLVKFTSIPKVYAIAYPRVLRWITTEALASTLYGTDWKSEVVDMSDSLLMSFTTGNSITTATDYVVSRETSLGSSINNVLP
jgi:hypothetical protein